MHTQPSKQLWMHNMNSCKAQNKERDRESQWIKRKQQDMFRGSSTQLYIPAFDTRRISNPLASPQRTLTRSTQLLSLQPQPPSWGKLQSSNNHLTTWGITTTQYKDHLTTWGIQPKCTTSSTQWGKRHKANQGFTTWWSMLAQRPFTLVLMMINSCSYSY